MGCIMKYFLCLLVLHSAEIYGETPSKYDLLKDILNYTPTENIERVDGNEKDAYRIANNVTVSMQVDKLTDSESLLKLKTPFEIYANLEMTVETGNVFSIKHSSKEKEALYLALSFFAVGDQLSRMHLLINNVNDTIPFEYEFNSDDREWVKLFFHVTEDSVTLVKNCEFDKAETVILSTPLKEVNIPKTAMLFVGSAHETDKDLFKGAIEDLQILPNLDTYDQNTICEGDKLPDSFFRGPFGDDGSKSDMKEAEKGEKGEPGLKGERGERGEKGEWGKTGAPGISVTGPRGPQGHAGPAGPKGTDGMKGPQGPRGERGETGEDGDDGATGAPGKIGERGPPGEMGKRGESGADGSPGRDGREGPKGEPGKDGSPGIRGPEGPPGPPGPPGPSGPVPEEIEVAKELVPAEKGDMGPAGPPGVEGPMGKNGEKGEKGASGEKGTKGDTVIHKGVDGKPGPRGETGAPGENGIPGTHGKHGRHGEKGDRGDKGDKGDEGPAGAPAKLSSLLDVDINPIEYAAIIERFKGAKGDDGKDGQKGDKGEIGLTGPVGPPGKDGSHGPKGSRGGRGEPGERGVRGEKGESGPPGAPGNVPESAIALMKGPKGDIGQKGDRGTYGKRGGTGPRGWKGEPGSSGVQGPRGEKGDRGEPGKDGTPGPIGPRGECNWHNVTVPRGAPGPPGPPGPPGVSITGPKGEPARVSVDNYFEKYNEVDQDMFLGDDDFFMSTTVMLFKSKKGLIKRKSTLRLGTLAYILDEDELFLRVQKGWEPVLSRAKRTSNSNTVKLLSKPVVHSRRPINTQSYIRMIALDEPYAGNMLTRSNRTGRSAVDLACHQAGSRLTPSGKFAAFLSTKQEDLKEVIKVSLYKEIRDIPIVNLKLDPLFSSWESIFDGSETRFSSDIFSFNGRKVLNDDVWPTKAIWHGSNVDGKHKSDSCDEWSTIDQQKYGSGSPLYNHSLLQQKWYSCNTKLIVLCIESKPQTREAQTRRRRHNQYARHRYMERHINTLN